MDSSTLDEQLPTVLTLPHTLPYPITLTQLLVRPGERAQRGQPVLRYSYLTQGKGLETDEGDELDDGIGGSRKRKHPGGRIRERLLATWETPIEGEVVQWEDGIRERMVLHGPKQDYLNSTSALDAEDSRNSKPRAGPTMGGESYAAGGGGVEISHDSSRLKVSLDEAHRIALQARQGLLAAKKLILVVDLDQTVIHAAVDPTIGEWLDECFGNGYNLVKLETDEDDGLIAHSEGHLEGPEQTEGDVKSSSPYSTSERRSRASNPNAAALKDVFRFRLLNELPPELKGKYRNVFRGSNMCWYYIKPRPGLPEFLERTHQRYEMHVYTAGSRAYANAVCKGIDPTGKYFNERILSRDESGNVAQKDLRRLFPTDQSMVVVIDDRWEVWSHAPNLVKVVPYDFFVGMGDINAAFVSPRATDILPSTATTAPEPEHPASSDDAEAREREALQQAHDLEDQLEHRPLKRLQEELSHAKADTSSASSAPPTHESESSESDKADESPTDSGDMPNEEGQGRSVGDGVQNEQPEVEQAILRNDDTELHRIQSILDEIHGRFFEAFAQSREGYRVPPSVKPDPHVLFDVRHIVPHMQRKVLSGCVILFSSVIPSFQRPENNEFWILASMFGAKCVKSLTPDVTHLVTANFGTEKVHRALKQPSTRIVSTEWLKRSIDLWKREAEGPYQMRPESIQNASVLDQDAQPTATDTPNTPAELAADDDDSEDQIELDQSELDEMDAELREFMDDMTDSETGSVDGSLPPTPRRKRPRKSILNPSRNRSGVCPDQKPVGQPVRKKARFEADEKDDARDEYDDAIQEKQEEDYDEYLDEGGGSLLTDATEVDQTGSANGSEGMDEDFEKELQRELEQVREDQEPAMRDS